MRKEDMIKRTYWKFWWVSGLQDKPSYFFRGSIMIGTVLLFPLWSPIYLLYWLVESIGGLNGKPKRYETWEEKEELEKSYY